MLARLTEATGDDATALSLYLRCPRNVYSYRDEIKSGIVRCMQHGQDASAAIVKALTSGDASSRATIADAITDLSPQPPAVIQALTSALKDPNADVRIKVAGSLSSLHASDGPVIAGLIALLDDPDQRVRIAAVDALATIGPPATPGIIAQLRGPKPQARHGAILVLQKMDPKQAQAVIPLAEALKDADSSVRSAAADALAEFGPDAAAAVPELLATLKRAEPSEVQASVIQALGKIGPAASEAVRPLATMLADRLDDPADIQGFDGQLLALALRGIGPKADAAVVVLAKAIHSTHMRVPYAAASALGAIGANAKSAIPDLIDLMGREPEKDRDLEALPLASIAVSLREHSDTTAITALRSVREAFEADNVNPVRIAAVQGAMEDLETKLRSTTGNK